MVDPSKKAALGIGNAAKNHEIYVVPGLQRGLLALEAIATAGEPLAPADIARRIGVSRSSVFRLIYTLRHMRFLELARDGVRFTLGPRVLNMGFAYLASMDIVELARPELEILRDRTKVSTHLAVRDGQDILYLCCVQTRSGFLSTINVGARFAAYATPMGWLLLGDLSPRDIAYLYRRQRMHALTKQTPRDIPTLVERVDEAANRGYVISRGVIESGGSSIAAPVRGRDGKVAAAIDVAGPDSAFDLARLEGSYLAEVRETADRISARLGYVSESV
jgi:DNA-binding IclR family transcriptional regulator